MHKKAIIVIAIIVGLLIVTSGVVGAILVLNKKTDSNTGVIPGTVNGSPEEQESQTTPDLSVDLGACTVVSQADVSGAVSPQIATVRDAVNRGFGYEKNGDKSQSCVYPFSADSNLTNRLTITVTAFNNETNKNNSISDLNDFTAVQGIGEKAAFTSETDETSLQQNTYSLFFINDMTLYRFTIAQPIDGDKFTAATAQSALETLAKSL
jgi:hypothetical protein